MPSRKPLSILSQEPSRVARLLGHLCLPLLLSLAVSSHAFSASETALFEGTAAQDAVRKLKEKLPSPAKALRVDIRGQELIVQVQDPAAPTHLDAYTYSLPDGPLGLLTGASVSGPEPVELSRIYQQLDGNVFDLNEVNFAAVAETAREAVKQTALDGGGAVAEIRIQRQLFLLPTSHSGDVEWDISVRGPRERATAYADGRGHITHLDLHGTARARAINYLNGGKALDDAVALIHQNFGNGRVFLNVQMLTSAYLTFRAQDPKPPHAIKRYSCDINGISESGGLDPFSKNTPESQLFGFEDMDWSRYAVLSKAALDKLAIPDARIVQVEVSRPLGLAGSQPVQWKFDVRGREDGTVIFDQRGAIVRFKLPPSQRKALNFFEPANALAALAGMHKNADVPPRLMNILLREDRVSAELPDRQQPSQTVTFEYSEEQGVHGSHTYPGLLSKAAFEARTFDFDELEKGPVPLLAELEKKTLDRLHMADGKIERITFFRESPLFPGNKLLLTEIRVHGQAGDGRVTFDARGKAVETMTP